MFTSSAEMASHLKKEIEVNKIRIDVLKNYSMNDALCLEVSILKEINYKLKERFDSL